MNAHPWLFLIVRNDFRFVQLVFARKSGRRPHRGYSVPTAIICFMSCEGSQTPFAQIPNQSATFATYPRVVEVARAMPQSIDSILDAAEQQQASDVFLQEDEVPRLKVNEQIIVQIGRASCRESVENAV